MGPLPTGLLGRTLLAASFDDGAAARPLGNAFFATVLDGPVLVAPVGRSLGIPPANKLPKSGIIGGPGTALAGAGALVRLAPPAVGPAFASSAFPGIIGALRSLVTVFFNAAPALMDSSRAPRFSTPPPPPAFLAPPNCIGGGPGGGGGGGGGMSAQIESQQTYLPALFLPRTPRLISTCDGYIFTSRSCNTKYTKHFN
jgi:hypothetical protein